MTVKFGYGNGTYLAVVSPTGRRELETVAENIQADPSLWTSRQKKTALNLRLENESDKSRYVRKNVAQRRGQSRLAMRRLYARRKQEVEA